MASNKKPMNKKPQNKKTDKPVAKTTIKPVAKKPITVKETKVEQVSIAEQIPETICTCEKPCVKKHKTTYVILGIIVVLVLLSIIF